ncbi:MAG: DUF2177 family protein [Candidatus Saccharicenans sp.]
MSNILKMTLLWILAFVLFSLVDAIWHLVIFRHAYQQDFRPLARVVGEKIVFRATWGVLAQFFLVSSLIILVLMKNPSSLKDSVLVGLLAGVLAITVYGFTNYSLMKDWSLRLTLLEAIWGPILGSWGGLVVGVLYRWLFR